MPVKMAYSRGLVSVWFSGDELIALLSGDAIVFSLTRGETVLAKNAALFRLNPDGLTALREIVLAEQEVTEVARQEFERLHPNYSNKRKRRGK